MLKVANSVISASRITGVLPVANGGTGVTTSTGTGNTVLSATPTLSGDITLSTGNLVISTSGKGIDFSITSSGSGTMTSELLADYEEGTWTPVIRGDGTAGTYELNAATAANYTKIGRQVTISAFIRLAAAITAGGTGDMQISGVPFNGVWPTNDWPQGAIILRGINFTAGSLSIAFAGEASGQSNLYIRSTQVNATEIPILISGVSANDLIGFSFTYTASA